RHIIPEMDYPSAFSNWLTLWYTLSAESRELAVCGTDAEAAVRAVNSHYLPHVIVAGCTAESTVPFLQSRFVKDDLLFYVCRNKSCNLPVSAIKQALNDLK